MPTEKETIDELTKQLKVSSDALEATKDQVKALTEEVNDLKNSNPKDVVDLAQKNLRLELDDVTSKLAEKTESERKLKAELLKVSQDLDQANRAKIIGDLKGMGCTLTDRDLNSMETDELDSLRDASKLFKANQPSVGVKAFGDAEDQYGQNGRLTVPTLFKASLLKTKEET